MADAPPNEKPPGFCSGALAPNRLAGGCAAGVVDAPPKLGAGVLAPGGLLVVGVVLSGV